ncbi:hypothetical protein BDZ94DRAFT_1308568 [Collybia nuda]|uniref:Uncharacterized protein n=1 Tax=Collybia nuda TaxID=64659 RepID=A0A9P5Y7N8_9AGAR|nr:hypothetical protein BDZ94DRAFT_1308568 [Collybia nuda]
MSYVNPLHAPVSAASRSQFSSLGGAVNGVPSASQFISPNRRRLPQAPYTPSTKSRGSGGRASQLNHPIAFDYLGHSKQGIPMRELSTRGGHTLASMVHGAGDQVLVHTGLARINLHILWPGYEHVGWTEPIEIHLNGPIARAQLGAAVAMSFARFVEKTRSQPSRSPEWHLSPTGIRFDQLVLVSMYNVFEDVWQADVAVDLR